MTVLKEEIQYFLLSNNVDHNFSVFHSSVINQQFDLKIAWKKIFSLFLIQDNVDKIKLTKKSEILFYIPLIQFLLPLYLFFLVYSSQFRLHSVHSLSIQKAWLQKVIKISKWRTEFTSFGESLRKNPQRTTKEKGLTSKHR